MFTGLLLSLLYRYIEEVPRDTLSRYRPVPQNRSIHQIITTDQPCELILRELSCYTCVYCSEGQYADCINPHTGISKKHLMQKEQQIGETDDEENEEPDFETLIEKDAILALFTDNKNADYYLLKAVSAPEILKRKIKDGWVVTHERGTKVVKGYYFEKINNNILNYRLVKNVIACVPFLSVKHILLVDIYTDLLQLTENDHLDILSAIDLHEN